MSALRAKGLGGDLAERSVQRLDATEEERADALAAERAARLMGLDPSVAFQRLSSFLIRRGFAPGLAFGAARRALDVREPDES